MTLWTGTVGGCFVGAKAKLAKTQAARITYSTSRRLLGESGSEFVAIERDRRRLDT